MPNTISPRPSADSAVPTRSSFTPSSAGVSFTRRASSEDHRDDQHLAGEHPPPRGVGRERAADQRAQRGGDRAGGGDEPVGARALGLAEVRRDQRHDRGHDQHRAQALQARPADHQHRQVRRQRRRQRPAGVDDAADRERALAAEDLADLPAGDHQRRHHQRVQRDRRLDPGHRGVRDPRRPSRSPCSSPSCPGPSRTGPQPASPGRRQRPQLPQSSSLLLLLTARPITAAFGPAPCRNRDRAHSVPGMDARLAWNATVHPAHLAGARLALAGEGGFLTSEGRVEHEHREGPPFGVRDDRRSADPQRDLPCDERELAPQLGRIRRRCRPLHHRDRHDRVRSSARGALNAGASHDTLDIVVLVLLVAAAPCTPSSRARRPEPPKWMGKLQTAQPQVLVQTRLPAPGSVPDRHSQRVGRRLLSVKPRRSVVAPTCPSCCSRC